MPSRLDPHDDHDSWTEKPAFPVKTELLDRTVGLADGEN
jgi:hypothetical protein